MHYSWRNTPTHFRTWDCIWVTISWIIRQSILLCRRRTVFLFKFECNHRGIWCKCALSWDFSISFRLSWFLASPVYILVVRWSVVEVIALVSSGLRWDFKLKSFLNLLILTLILLLRSATLYRLAPPWIEEAQHSRGKTISLSKLLGAIAIIFLWGDCLEIYWEGTFWSIILWLLAWGVLSTTG